MLKTERRPPAARRGDHRHAIRDRVDLVSLVDLEPDLAATLPEDDRLIVRRLAVRGVRLHAGAWAASAEFPAVVAVRVLDGVLLHSTTSFARPDLRLFGPDDVIDGPLVAEPQGTWRVLEPARVAILDDRYIAAASRWPALLSSLVSRLFDAQREAHVVATIATMPRVEERLLALLCHLAERWGHVTPAGVTVALPVSHTVLGALIGARRPTVSLALTALSAQGLLRRAPDGQWLLPPECGAWADAGIPGARPARRG